MYLVWLWLLRRLLDRLCDSHWLSKMDCLKNKIFALTSRTAINRVINELLFHNSAAYFASIDGKN